MRKFYLLVALNVGSAFGWWAGDQIGIWAALLGSAAGAVACIWLVWRYRDLLGE